MASLHWMGQAPESDRAVVFVHGVNGHWRSTWEHSGTGYCWPERMALDRSWLTASVEYDVNTNWGRATMPLQDRAINLLDLLSNDALLAGKELCIVAHSFGGLVTKQVVRAAFDRPRTYGALVDRLAGIVFLGTPHLGAGVATLLDHLRFLLGSTVTAEDLRSSAPLLRDLGDWFRSHEQASLIPVLSLYETRRTAIGRRWLRLRTIQVVDAASADPGVRGSTPVPIDGDHAELSKPESSSAQQVVSAAKFLADCFRMPARLRRLPQQVAAVCYERSEGGVRFLLVRTTGGRWTFPKGRLDDFRSAPEAAEGEASEEAGARGTLDPEPLGVYLHAKQEWKKSVMMEIAVTAFLLRVEARMRHEEGREPTWFTPDDAKRALAEGRDLPYSRELERMVDLALERLSSAEP